MSLGVWIVIEVDYVLQVVVGVRQWLVIAGVALQV